MAYDKVVDSYVLDAGLKQIADAIREKAGTTDSLAFPAAMAEAIAAIEAGGGGGGIPSNITELAGGTYTAASKIGQTLKIVHGMGKTPSMAVLWSESTNTGGLGWGVFFGGGGGYFGSGKGTGLAYANLSGGWRRGEVLDSYELKPSLSGTGTSANAGDTFHWLAWV